MIEFELRIPVAKWLLSRGLSPIVELRCLNNCDLVGARFEKNPTKLVELVAVELKLKNVTEVIRQCEHHEGRPVTETWAAMPPEVANKNSRRFDVAGLGLLAVSVDSGLVEIVCKAVRHDDADLTRWQKTMWRRRDEHLWRMKNPNMLHYDKTPRDRVAGKPIAADIFQRA